MARMSQAMTRPASLGFTRIFTPRRLLDGADSRKLRKRMKMAPCHRQKQCKIIHGCKSARYARSLRNKGYEFPLFVPPGLFALRCPAAGAGSPLPAFRPSPQTQVRTRKIVGDRIVMRSGGLTEINGNRGSRIDMDTMLAGGIRVTPGGTVYLPDGTSKSLEDGQKISAAGNIMAATPEEITIANAALDSGTGGAGQQVRDQANQAHNAALEAHEINDPSTNDRTIPMTTGSGIIQQAHPGTMATMPATRMSTNTAVTADGPNHGAPAPPMPNPGTATDIRRDELRANRQLPSQQQ